MELCVGGLVFVLSLYVFGEFVGKGKSDWGNEGRSFSFGSRLSCFVYLMVEIVGEVCEFYFFGFLGFLIFCLFLLW